MHNRGRVTRFLRLVPFLEQPGQPASVKHGGEWFCEFHYDALVDLDSHWQALLRVADQCEPYEFADIWLKTEDGGWVVFEGVEVEGMD